MKDKYFSDAINSKYEVFNWRHASAIMKEDFPQEWKDVNDVLSSFKLKQEYLAVKGGNKSLISKWFDEELNRKRGWEEKLFETSIMVDHDRTDSPTHSIDCFKNKIALELEWNNKDPFYDRDLNNFRLLFDLRVVAVGIIVTRSDALQDIFDDLGKGSSYGNSTTHMSKLLPKIRGGGAGGCPVLVFAMKKALYE